MSNKQTPVGYSQTNPMEVALAIGTVEGYLELLAEGKRPGSTEALEALHIIEEAYHKLRKRSELIEFVVEQIKTASATLG